MRSCIVILALLLSGCFPYVAVSHKDDTPDVGATIKYRVTGKGPGDNSKFRGLAGW